MYLYLFAFISHLLYKFIQMKIQFRSAHNFHGIQNNPLAFNALFLHSSNALLFCFGCFSCFCVKHWKCCGKCWKSFCIIFFSNFFFCYKMFKNSRVPSDFVDNNFVKESMLNVLGLVLGLFTELYIFNCTVLISEGFLLSPYCIIFYITVI